MNVPCDFYKGFPADMLILVCDLIQTSRINYNIVRLNCFKPAGLWQFERISVGNDYFSLTRLFLINFLCIIVCSVNVGCQHRPINMLKPLRISTDRTSSCYFVFFSGEEETRLTILCGSASVLQNSHITILK